MNRNPHGSSRTQFQRIAIALLILCAAVFFLWRWTHQGVPAGGALYQFEGIQGPAEKTAVPTPAATDWAIYDHGDAGRLAILLTDTDSAWLGLVHGLKAIGVPFRITRDYRQAIQHKSVLVYPTVSGKALEADALRALAQFGRERGTLIASQVVGGGLNEFFGFKEAVTGQHSEVTFDTQHRLAASFTDPLEKVIRVGNPASGSDRVSSIGYTAPGTPPLAVYEDGTPAITQKAFAGGRAYALGMDLGYLLLKAYNNREEGLSRSYVNGFEPSVDVLLRLLKAMYEEAEPSAVTLHTVPANGALAVVMSHDIDYTRSLNNAVTYAQYEKSQGITATHFIQTKYIKDWNDDIFFNAQGVPLLAELTALGVEVGSHSVSHSRSMNKFPLGSGTESYPDYAPFVKDDATTLNGTVLGELRVSKFLLEKFLPQGTGGSASTVVSFRPGHLRNPYTLTEALDATGYRFSSSVTANNSLTHLPFQLTYNRSTTSEMNVFEFPVTVEDEAAPPLKDRLDSALALARRIARYGGAFVVLIHTDVLADKLQFEKDLVAALRPIAWFGSVRGFGEWWAARNRVECDPDADGMGVRVSLPEPVRGLTLQLPVGVKITRVQPSSQQWTQAGDRLVLDGPASGAVQLRWSRAH